MVENFSKLSNEEQKKILDSAYKVFTDTPYERASTNTIVKDAGISKGKLFYYFKDKATLYAYLVEYGLNHIKNAYIDKLSLEEKDFLKRFQTYSNLKKQVYDEEPHLFGFMSYIFLNDLKHVSFEQSKLIKHYQSLTVVYVKKDIDVSLFREDIDPDTIMRLIEYTLQGYQNELIAKFKEVSLKEENMAPYYEDYEHLMEAIRKIYYK